MTFRFNLIQWAVFVIAPFLAVAQPNQYVSSVRTGDSARISGSKPSVAAMETAVTSASETTEVSSETLKILPFFGERTKTAAQIGEEIHFLNDCDRNFATRTEASDFFANRGWDYVGAGQLDTAAYRFNLAWLLNNRNPEAYWGLGVVSYQKNQLAEAIRIMKKGVAVGDNHGELMTDLATLEIKFFQEKADADVLTDAETHLQKAVTISPTSAASFQKLSVVYYLKADYAKAWEYLHQAHTLDLTILDFEFLSDLLAKQPDPKGLFK